MLGVVRLLEVDPWFAGLPPGCRGWFAAAARKEKLVDGQCVYRAGDPPSGLFRVLSGEVRLVSYPETGRPLTNLAARTGCWFGELSILDGGPRPHDAIAAGRSLVLHIPLADIQAMGRANPALYQHIALLACQQHRATIDHIGLMLLRSPPARLAHVLLRMAGEAPCQQLVRINREELACRIGMPRDRLSRLLEMAEQGGLIRTIHGRIEILNFEGLSSLT
ncbi:MULTISPECIES: Crp/Fnr family transcriptional regulator [unclassified Azospirillum]|uniref:Crp/Fnr family transcriptional regulator n=1 Tax=unclassified Azospirillum TaxID=2630922 RepID=UPI000B6663DE|nr:MULTISPECIES: Crp/Fnr family transcriptional regulator [unclassified Azospirillum]SNS73557.1 transcriptional regulator, Crp/Fnr family [Azospirillum sp. RU38E]SNS91374.1 transcriptional regulator, Crp/Fnr family [Azospirillum sp. RU37A]